MGAELGGITIAAGIAGALLNGWLADRWHARDPAGRVWAVWLAVLLEVLALLLAATASNYTLFLAYFGVFCLAGGGWAGVTGALGFDILRPSDWGTGIATYFLVTTLLGPAIGPFAVGFVSDATGSLRQALTWIGAVDLVALVALLRLGWLVRRNAGTHIREWSAGANSSEETCARFRR